ncbi:hypothetical protein Leryth_001966 [Lithospermum erythrorhizon]|uniref:ZF-HD dimerization-type domain-containing protein n=1 Tax=Lithospermum erythrorhizon TaxID=34254 RepID=A0AAV3NTF6_LITER|nr:hypothetical protein Leryth_001966 [Lithospermum erythrorhizon]
MEGDNNNLYRECLRNHAASLGSYATDGCGEFTQDDTTSDGGLHCAACGCHRNFHRRVTYGATSYTFRGGDHHMMEDSPPHSGREDYNMNMSNYNNSNKKRYRTKFTGEQKEKMMGFAEKLGWKLQRKDNAEEDEVERFCKGIGLSRKVFKVWMHNHKNSSSTPSPSPGNASSLTQQ